MGTRGHRGSNYSSPGTELVRVAHARNVAHSLKAAPLEDLLAQTDHEKNNKTPTTAPQLRKEVSKGDTENIVGVSASSAFRLWT